MKFPSKQQIKDFYDGWGLKQDTAGEYETLALRESREQGGFKNATHVFEFGFGTGRFAKSLFELELNDACLYTGIDLSETMFDIATKRLEPWSDRITLLRSCGKVSLDMGDESVDRFVSHFVCDILSPHEVTNLLDEVHRILKPEGLVILAGLHPGENIASRSRAMFWNVVYRLNPVWVGGCRPMALMNYVNSNKFSVAHHHVTGNFGLASEILVLRKRT